MQKLDITIGKPHEEGVYDIIKVIRPTWTTDRLLLKVSIPLYTNGYIAWRVCIDILGRCVVVPCSV